MIFTTSLHYEQKDIWELKLHNILLLSRKLRDSFNIFDKTRYILVKDILLVILLDLGGVHDPQKSDLPVEVFPFPSGPLHRVDRVPHNLVWWKAIIP